MPKFRYEDVSMLVSAIRREPGRFVFLTGAGMSMSAGVPSSTWLLAEIRQKFASELSGLTATEQQDLSACMGALAVEERLSILKPYFESLKVNWAHIALACMMRANFVNRVLTFNVDNILARACGLVGLYPATYDFGISAADDFEYLSNPSIIHLRGQGYGPILANNMEEAGYQIESLRPLLNHTLSNSNIVVVGYNGKVDPFFPLLINSFSGRRRIYWLGHKEEPSPHLEELLRGRHQNLVRYFGGVDADEIMIQLAQRLGCFPPDVITNPARHILSELTSIAAFPLEKTDLTVDILEAARAKLRGEGDHLKINAISGGTVGTRADLRVREELQGETKNDNRGLPPVPFNTQATPTSPGYSRAPAMPRVDPMLPRVDLSHTPALEVSRQPSVAANAPETVAKAPAPSASPPSVPNPAPSSTPNAAPDSSDTEIRAWAHFVEGYNNCELAETSDPENNLRKACDEYAKAVRLKPDFYEALNNWGIALRKLGEIRREEVYYTHAIHKYEHALKNKPDFLQALNNWAIALSDLAKLRGDDSLYALSIEKYEQALAIKPDFYQALNDWGSKLSMTWKLTEKDEYLRRADDVWAQALELNPRQVFEKAIEAAKLGNEQQCRELLEKCLSYGTLPSVDTLTNDLNLHVYRHREWFVQLIEKLRKNKKVG